MTTLEKLSYIAETEPVIYNEAFRKGQLNTINSSEVLKGNEIGTVVKMDDVSPIEHDLNVKIESKNLFNPPYTNRTFTAYENGQIWGVSHTDITKLRGKTITYQLQVDFANTIETTAQVRAAIWWYDADKKYLFLTTGVYIKNDNGIHIRTVTATVPQEATYAMIGASIFFNSTAKPVEGSSITVSNPMIELGSTATTYTPYFSNSNGKKNLIPQYIDGINDKYTGRRNQYHEYLFTISLPAGTKITMSADIVGETMLYCMPFYENGTYDAGGNYVAFKSASGRQSLTFTATKDVFQIGVYVLPIGESFLSYVANSIPQRMQLEIGDVATNYIPSDSPENTLEGFKNIEVNRYGTNLFKPYNAENTVNGVTAKLTEDGFIETSGEYSGEKTLIYLSPPSGYEYPILPAGDYYKYLNSYNGIYLSNDVNILFQVRYLDGSWGDNIGDTSGIVSFSKPSRVTNIVIVIKTSKGANMRFPAMMGFAGLNITEFEPFKEPQTATATADGTVEGLASISPNMTLATNTDGISIECQYYKDIDRAYNKLESQIVSLGGELA